MGLQTWVGYFIFFGVPLLLWALGTAAIRRRGLGARAVAFISGSDNRLSLSRLQAFLWTLVIFGSWAAAMGIHTKISTISTQEAADRVVEAKATAATAAKRKAEADTRADAARESAARAATAKAEADNRAEVARRLAEAFPGDAAKADDAKKTADAAREAAIAFVIAEKSASERISEAEAGARAKAAADRAAAVSGNEWVKIPTELLALAGIAIGSGVFSSLISAVKSEEKTACVTDIQSIDLATYLTGRSNALAAASSKLDADPNATVEAKAAAADRAAAAATAAAAAVAEKAAEVSANRLQPYCLIINGQGMVKAGRVRFGKTLAPIRDWNDAGTQIVVDVPPNFSRILIVDTGNGKLCYKLLGGMANFSLGQPTSSYEAADLFRDDKNPSNMDLMKFQMFGWTVIAIVIYTVLFLSDLHNHIETLPQVDSSIVILTGLSQGGYLTGKALPSAKTPQA